MVLGLGTWTVVPYTYVFEIGCDLQEREGTEWKGVVGCGYFEPGLIVYVQIYANDII